MSNDPNEQDSFRGRMMALAIDFGTLAKNTWASVETLLGSGHEIDASELDVVSKTWTTAAGLIWSALGTDPWHGEDRALVRIGLTDLAGLLARDEQLTRRVAELEAALANAEPDPRAEKQQDIQSLYIAGGSSERLTVGRVWIDRAISAGARITFDWTRASGYAFETPPENELLGNAMTDVRAVMGAGVFWLLAPEVMSEGASTELGIAIASAVSSRIGDKPRARIVVSGPHARRNLFALLADETYETHEQAWEAIRPRVAGVAT